MESLVNSYATDYKNIDDEQLRYKNSTYDLVSKISYLIGVPKRIFEHDYEPPRLPIYNQLEPDKNARIIRHLCILRTALIRNFKHIEDAMVHDYRTILYMPEYIPDESVRQLSMDNIPFYKKTNVQVYQHIIEINRIINDRINNCKNLFAAWLDFNYIRQLFIMPEGLSEDGIQKAMETFYNKFEKYPYQQYLNWRPRDLGNILFNDKKFVTILYKQHNAQFTELARVSDVGSFVKNNIDSFMYQAKQVVMVVDCENSDPYRLCATLGGLPKDAIAKINKVMLFDDVNTVHAWQILESYTSIPVEHIMTERVKQAKSLVDIQLTARTCVEHYENNVDSFILVSSDSDYWGLITTLSNAQFLVMIEREKCGPDMKDALASNGIFYCYIEDFNSENHTEIKKTAIFNEIYHYLDENLALNANKMLDVALATARITMTVPEKRQFFEKHIRPMKLVIDADGKVSLELKRF